VSDRQNVGGQGACTLPDPSHFAFGYKPGAFRAPTPCDRRIVLFIHAAFAIGAKPEAIAKILNDLHKPIAAASKDCEQV
jgi:hypothetical protein